MNAHVSPEALERLTRRIDALLPQTQCRKCGYAGCKPYAEAIAADAADINRCPPGGDPGIARLAQLLGREVKPLDPSVGPQAPPVRALIDEAQCIGCTLCIQACPVDAIVGASKQMHTVIAAWCTGCELCLPPCPVDCIALVPAAPPADEAARDAAAAAARRRFEQRNRRLARDQREKAERLARKLATRAEPAAAGDPGEDRKRALIAAALARAQAQKAHVAPRNTESLSDAQRAEIAAVEARRRRNRDDA